MNIKIIILSLLLLFSSQSLYAKKESHASVLLQANDETSFMHYEFHSLAYEAAVNKNYEDAYRIYSKLAKKGDNRAEYNIGMMYMNGLGVERKKMDAYKWLRRASKHGNKEATLYFKEMNERYAKKHEASETKFNPTQQTTDNTKSIEKNTSTLTAKSSQSAKQVQKVKRSQSVQKKEEVKEDSSPLLYLLIAGVLVILSLAFFFFKKSASTEKKPAKDAPKQPKHKSQMYQSTYANILDYHTELLKQVNLTQLKADKNKMKIYYMFLYGVIDYFCQLETFTDAEQRRIFSTHMGEQEGQENLTAITQSILEGQRDSSMYHYQAAGGISAKAWNTNRSADALSMLKRLILEKKA